MSVSNSDARELRQITPHAHKRRAITSPVFVFSSVRGRLHESFRCPFSGPKWEETALIGAAQICREAAARDSIPEAWKGRGSDGLWEPKRKIVDRGPQRQRRQRCSKKASQVKNAPTYAPICKSPRASTSGQAAVLFSLFFAFEITWFSWLVQSLCFPKLRPLVQCVERRTKPPGERPRFWAPCFHVLKRKPPQKTPTRLLGGFRP